jgi:hypothetical protein
MVKEKTMEEIVKMAYLKAKEKELEELRKGPMSVEAIARKKEVQLLIGNLLE